VVRSTGIKSSCPPVSLVCAISRERLANAGTGSVSRLPYRRQEIQVFPLGRLSKSAECCQWSCSEYSAQLICSDPFNVRPPVDGTNRAPPDSLIDLARDSRPAPASSPVQERRLGSVRTGLDQTAGRAKAPFAVTVPLPLPTLPIARTERPIDRRFCPPLSAAPRIDRDTVPIHAKTLETAACPASTVCRLDQG
jgi:hypothetical protein